MTRAVIQPSYGNPTARQHWVDTLDHTVPFTQPPHADTLEPDHLGQLLAHHPGGEARFWGATGNHDAKMATLETGDIVLFTGKNYVRGIGEVATTFRNIAFADTLWAPDPDKGSWHNVYSLRAFQPVLIPYQEIWDLPGFNHGDNFMGLRFLDATKSDTVLAGLDIHTQTAAELDAQYDNDVEHALQTGTIVPAEAVNTTHTTYTPPAGPVLVHRAEALLVQEYRTTLSTPTSRIRTPDGGLTDIYIPTAEGGELIEAKSSSDRHHVRQALSQLLDYTTALPQPPTRLAALFPTAPAPSCIYLLHRFGIDSIHRTESGHFTRNNAPDDVRAHMTEHWTTPAI